MVELTEANVTFEPVLIGRDEESAELRSMWDGVRKGKGTTAMISGEAGIGKTRLVDEFLQSVEGDDASVIRGWCLADNLEPLMPFREGFRDAGLPLFVSDDPPPKVVSIYLINQGGLMITKAEREESDLDPDIFTSMLNAISNFVTDSLGMMGEKEYGGLNTIGYGKHNILIQSIEGLSLATVIEGTNSEFLIEDMKNTLLEIGDRFDSWDGDADAAERIKPNIDWFINSSKYNGRYLVDDPKLRQENLFDSVLLGLRRISWEQPIILFLDDLQWAEPTTLRLLHYISRNTRDNRVMIIGTYRPEDVVETDEGKAHPLKTTMQNMSREDLFHEMALERLDPSTGKEFIRSALEQSDLSDEFINKIYEESEGNPFFLLEVIRMLVLEKHLINSRGIWEAGVGLEGVHIPSKVYDIVVRRVDRLKEEHRDLLECASVIGEEFESSLIGNMLGMNRIKILKGLNTIERTHDLIHSIKKKYKFDHSKIREVLYNSINEELKQEYHCLAAESYKELYGISDDRLYELAKHYFRGDRYDEAFDYYKKTAKMAKSTYANQLAIECYDRLLDILTTIDREDVDELRIEFSHDKGGCLKSIGGWADAEKSYRSALMIAERIGEKDKIAECKIKIGDIRQLEADYDEALELYSDASNIFEAEQHEKGYCESLGKVASVYNNISEYDKAMERLSEMQELAEKLQDEDLLSMLYASMGSAHYGMGDIPESMGYFEKKLEIEKQKGDLLEIGYTMLNISTLYLKLQEYDKCMDTCNQVKEIVEKTGDKLMEQNVLGKLGIAHAEQGHYTEGLEYYKGKLSIAEKTGDRRSIAYVVNNIGELYKEKGEYDKALEYYERDMNISKDLGDKRGYAITVGNMGNLHKLMDDTVKAEELYDETIQIARDLNTKDVLCYFLSCKADLYFQKGMIESAEAMNEEALGIAENIKMRQTLFNTNLLKAKIISERDKGRGLEILIEMLENEYPEPEKARLLYELYKISGDDGYKKEALDFYKKIFEKHPSKKYGEIIRELESTESRKKL